MTPNRLEGRYPEEHGEKLKYEQRIEGTTQITSN
jgi:hypothetical protein